MSAPQLITICPDGSIFGLVHKTGLPLHKLGRADIKRVSDIEWDADHAAWFIRIKLGPWAGLVVDGALLDAYAVALPALRCASRRTFAGVLLCEDYADAVLVEIALVQAAQRRGEFWNTTD